MRSLQLLDWKTMGRTDEDYDGFRGRFVRLRVVARKAQAQPEHLGVALDHGDFRVQLLRVDR